MLYRAGLGSRSKPLNVPYRGDCLVEMPEAVPWPEPDMGTALVSVGMQVPAADAISIAGSSSAETELDDLESHCDSSVICATDGESEDDSLRDVANPLTHDVAELFSQPRLTARAERFGLRPGQHFDLVTGTDLATGHGRALVLGMFGRVQTTVCGGESTLHLLQPTDGKQQVANGSDNLRKTLCSRSIIAVVRHGCLQISAFTGAPLLA